jgi:hypothetical protein
MDKTETKIVYAYDATGLYIGGKVLDCTDRSPISGSWQVPANCTEIAPETKAGYDAYFASGVWTRVAQEVDVLCYYNNGLAYKKVKSTYTVSDGEILFNTTPTIAQLESSFSGYGKAVKVQKSAELDTEYHSQFTTLAQSLGLATLDGNQTIIDGIKSDYAALKTEYQKKLEEITNG